jgi:hypothetical protein
MQRPLRGDPFDDPFCGGRSEERQTWVPKRGEANLARSGEELWRGGVGKELRGDNGGEALWRGAIENELRARAGAVGRSSGGSTIKEELGGAAPLGRCSGSTIAGRSSGVTQSGRCLGAVMARRSSRTVPSGRSSLGVDIDEHRGIAVGEEIGSLVVGSIIGEGIV